MSNNKQRNKKSNSAANAKQKEIDQPNTVEQNQPKEKQTSHPIQPVQFFLQSFSFYPSFTFSILLIASLIHKFPL